MKELVFISYTCITFLHLVKSCSILYFIKSLSMYILIYVLTFLLIWWYLNFYLNQPVVFSAGVKKSGDVSLLELHSIHVFMGFKSWKENSLKTGKSREHIKIKSPRHPSSSSPSSHCFIPSQRWKPAMQVLRSLHQKSQVLDAVVCASCRIRKEKRD